MILAWIDLISYSVDLIQFHQIAPVVLGDVGGQGAVDPGLSSLGASLGRGNVSSDLGAALANVLRKSGITGLINVEESLGNGLAVVDDIDGGGSSVGSTGDGQGSASQEATEDLCSRRVQWGSVHARSHLEYCNRLILTARRDSAEALTTTDLRITFNSMHYVNPLREIC